MSSADTLKAVEEADWIAVASLSLAAIKIVTNEKLTKEDIESAGKALGWVALRDPEVFDMLVKGAEETKTPVFKKFITDARSPPKQDMPSRGAPPVESVRGGKRQRGGVAPFLLGLIAILLGGSKVYEVGKLTAQGTELREQALKEIEAACPISLSLPPPPPPYLVDWGGEHARASAKYKGDKAVCDAVRAVATQRVETANAAITNAMTKVPAQVGALALMGTIVSGGVINPATIGAAAAVGGAMAQVTEMIVSSALPTGRDLEGFVTQISKAFPAPSAAPAALTAPVGVPAIGPPDASPAPAAPSALPPRRGRGGKRTRKGTRKASRRRRTARK